MQTADKGPAAATEYTEVDTLVSSKAPSFAATSSQATDSRVFLLTLREMRFLNVA